MSKWPAFRNKRPVLPALLTPFDDVGKINRKALEELIEKLISEGVDGIFACGSAAEVFLLSRKERKKMLEIIMDTVDNRIPVIAHIGSTSQIEAFKLAEHAAKLGVAAISAVPPFYYRYTQQEIRDFYFGLADETGLSVLLYSIAMYTNVSLNMDFAGELFRDDRILGLKHTSLNLFDLNQIKRHCPDKLVLMGQEECMLGALAMGADGAIGATFNDTAPMAIKLRDLFEQNKMADALEVQNKIAAYCEALQTAGVTRGVKYALSLKGFDAGVCRDPYKRITEEGMRAMEKVIGENIAF